MILCFDLDDTLYNEIDYVYSGFLQVSYFLSENHLNVSKNDVFKKLKLIEKRYGRGDTFDRLLGLYNIRSKALLRKCISVYRTHKPSIKLDFGTIKLLSLCKDTFGHLYLVTDGNITVQRNKIRALNLHTFFHKCIPTYQYGIGCKKPSVEVFKKICRWEGKKLQQITYIGDNPSKDFVGLKKHGATTICLHNEKFPAKYFPISHQAHYNIFKLKDILPILLDK